MTDPDHQPTPQPEQDGDDQNVGLARELIELILHNKKWWLVPVILALLVIGLLAVLGSSALAPFIYPLF
ncbi:MAG: hypothetical protein H6810_01060 [Phycisphaeraceae bacterium]|nr:MAG: hypothetical protein H6810_01060 [Phycisphaeraceae bacterium]